MSIVTRIIITIFALIFLSACGAQQFTPRKADPLLNTQLGNLEVGSNTAIRRNVYVRLESAPSAGEKVDYFHPRRKSIIHSRKGGHRGEFCAEPPPEALEALATSFIAKADASQNENNVSAEFSNNLTTAVASTFKRSQGIQFYRDVTFVLCTAMVNGYISHEEYIEQLWRARDHTKDIILAEFKTGAWKAEPIPQVVFLDKPSPTPEETKK